MERRREVIGALLEEFLREKTGWRLSRGTCLYDDLREAFLAWCARHSPEIQPLSPEVRVALEQRGFVVAMSPPPGPRVLRVSRRR